MKLRDLNCHFGNYCDVVYGDARMPYYHKEDRGRAPKEYQALLDKKVDGIHPQVFVMTADGTSTICAGITIKLKED